MINEEISPSSSGEFSIPILGLGEYRNLYGKMNITENSSMVEWQDAHDIAEAHEFTFKAINDEIKSTNHSISETTVGKFRSVILVKLDLAARSGSTQERCVKRIRLPLVLRRPIYNYSKASS
ncbi:hypothetical protein GLOIN_2v1775713 [Rhizophagus irregularis DAOM 181602=DAOM 197198]|nr:hypothetical protein GLOIN_2v1775713 [Rhizophagus irregularis DAOM 181602=DAOM 197198]